MLIGAGIPVLNQSVLLRGVNDDPEVLVQLCEALVRRSVFPYYLHHTDNVLGNQHFRVSFDEGIAIYSKMREQLSGIALPRYVLDRPDGSGKVDVELYRSTVGVRGG
jgi:lysine 2,3-aminomutase